MAITTYTPNVSGSGGSHGTVHTELKTAVDKLGAADLLITSVTTTTAQATATITHGLSTTPTFFGVAPSVSEASASGIASDSTTITITRGATAAPTTYYVQASVI